MSEEYRAAKQTASTRLRNGEAKDFTNAMRLYIRQLREEYPPDDGAIQNDISRAIKARRIYSGIIRAAEDQVVMVLRSLDMNDFAEALEEHDYKHLAI